MKIFNEWEDYYKETSKPTKIIGNQVSYLPFSNNHGNIYIKNSQFKGIQSSGNGGCLKFTVTTGSSNFVVIEETLFYQCKTTDTTSNGGCIYFVDYGSLIFDQICGYDCNTGEAALGQFCYCSSNSGNIYNISMFSSSIINTYNINGNNPAYTIYFLYGKQYFSETNISNNLVQVTPTYELFYSNSYTIYCSFENNLANGYAVLCWAFNYLQSFIDKSQNSGTGGILWFHQHNVNMSSCYLIINRENNHGKLFYRNSEDCIFIVIDCSIDSQSFSNSEDCSIINTLNNISSNILILYNFEDCILHYKNIKYFHHLNNIEIETLLIKIKSRCCFHHYGYHQILFSYIMIQIH
jgi:hypothetical protein